jgi:hypothetical protein
VDVLWEQMLTSACLSAGLCYCNPRLALTVAVCIQVFQFYLKKQHITDTATETDLHSKKKTNQETNLQSKKEPVPKLPVSVQQK